MPFNKRILITIFQWSKGHAALAKPDGIKTTHGCAGRACRRIPGDLSGGIVSCLNACASKLGRAWFFISGSAWMG
jgi:hypothetical protein